MMLNSSYVPANAEPVGDQIVPFDARVRGQDESPPVKELEAEKVKALIEEAKRAKRTTEQNWRKYKSWYRGNQWKQNRPKFKVSQVINILFSVVETVHPLLTDDLPRVSVQPREVGQYETSDKVNRALEFLQEKLDTDSILSLALKDMCIYGNGILKVYWDRDADGGLGEIGISRVSPFFILPDPAAVRISDCGYIIESKPMDIDLIKLNYPEHADNISAENISTPSFLDWGEDGGNVVNVTKDEGYKYSSDGGGASRRNRAYIHEVWVKNLGLLLDSAAPMSELAAIYEEYPNGRVITMVGDTVLSDRKNPFNDGKYPFVKFDDYPDPDSFWSMGEIEQIMPQQREINKRASQLIENAQLTANPPMIVDANSGVDTKLMTSRPGLIIEKNPGSTVDYLRPPAVPEYVFKAQEEAKRDVDTVSGVQDVSQGRKPGGIIAGSAIEHLQEAAHTRIRDKIRNRNTAFVKVAKLMLSRMAQYYKVPRQIRIMGGDGQYTFEQLFDKEVGGIWDIKVETGTAVPLTQTSMFQQAITLFELGAIDKTAILEIAQFPNKDKVLARVEQREQEEKAQEQQAQEAQAMLQQQDQVQQQGQHQDQMGVEAAKINQQQSIADMEHQRYVEQQMIDRQQGAM